MEFLIDGYNLLHAIGWAPKPGGVSLERSRLRKQMRSLSDASPSDKTAKLKLDAELHAKKVVADVFAKTVNEYAARAAGKPKTHFDTLRQQQEALVDLNDQLDSEIGKLEDKQATHEGLGPLGRVKAHAYVSPGAGIRAHISGLKEMITEGEMMSANKATRQAFAPSKHPVASAAVLSLPVDTLGARGDKKPKRRSSVPPPPEPPQ